MSAVAASASLRELPPWERPAPPLAGLAARDAPAEELGWYAALLSMEDLWASVVEAKEPDCGQVVTPLRALLGRFLTHVCGGTPAFPLDDLQRVTAFLQQPLDSILENPNARLARTHKAMPWSRLEELDSHCLTWLMRQPGRNVREKIASCSRALGVTRLRSVEVAENRLVIAVAQELAPWLALRLFNSPSATHPVDEERRQQLIAVQDLIDSGLPASPLADVKRPLRAEANNALLGSGRYGCIWRSYLCLTARAEHFALRWQLGPQLVAATLALSLWARLAQRGDAFVPQDYACVQLAGTGCGVTDLPSLDVILSAGRPIRLAIAPAAAPTSFYISLFDAVDGERLWHWQIETDLVPGGPGATSVLVLVTAEDEATAVFDAPAHPAALFELAASLLAHFDLVEEGPASIQIAGVPGHAQSTPLARFLGLDLFTACPVLIEPTGQPIHREPCVFIEAALTQGKTERLTGAAALALQEDRPVQSAFALSASWAAIARGEKVAVELAEMLAWLLPTELLASECEVCLPVPDALGEPGEALLRAALPLSVTCAWIIPRAVAAALALRAAQAEALQPEDSLLVLDWGPLGFEARLLVLRRDTGAASSPDSLLWECPVPWEPVVGATDYSTHAHWLELTRAALPPGTPEPYIEKLASSGLTAQMALRTSPGTANAACALYGGRGQLGPLATISDTILAEAVARATRHFAVWLDSLRQAGVLQDIEEHVGGRPLQVILLGEPLELPQLAASMRDCCAQVLPQAVLHPSGATLIASGAGEFLQRRRQQLPTFELALPDLYLRVQGRDGRPTVQDIFRKRHVRPGDEIRIPPLAFELPARTRIELPLQRDPQGRRPMTYNAVLDEQLSEALPVELHVIYRYSEDGFRILIRPREQPGREPPFREREIRWVRSSAAAVQRQLVDEPPGFVDQAALADPPSATAIRPYMDDIDQFRVRTEAFLAEYAKTGNQAGWPQFKERLHATEKSVTQLLQLRPWAAMPAAIRDRVLNSWIEPLCLLADLSPAPYKPQKFRPSGVNQLPSLRKQNRQLGELAERGLSRLRQDAPTELAQRLFNRVCEKGGATRDSLMSLGRIFAALPDRVSKVCDLVPVVIKESREQFAALWCLATALWMDRQLVHDIAEAQVDGLLAALAKVLHAVDDDVNLYHEAGIVLFALLRLRGTALHHLVAAGSPRLCELADRIAELDRALVHAGKRREPRLTLGEQDQPPADMSRFADTLCAALRGERIALIRTLEDRA